MSRPGAGLLSAGVGVFCVVLSYGDSGPTGRAVLLGMATILVPLLFAIGWLFARQAAKLREGGHSAGAAALLAVGLAGLVWLGASGWRGHREHARLEAIKAETLTLERARALVAQGREETYAVIYNRTCPPQLLAELAKSPDESIRAYVGTQPGTPPDVVEALAKDPSAMVRRYVDWNPERRRAAEAAK